MTIPQAVAEELHQGQAFVGIWHETPGAKAIQVVSIPVDPLTTQFLVTLHAGEAEALTLAIRQGAQVLLCDDMDARRVAGYHRVPVSGTLGILIRAKRAGFIQAVTPHLDRLRQEIRFWIRDDLYHQIQEVAGEI